MEVGREDLQVGKRALEISRALRQSPRPFLDADRDLAPYLAHLELRRLLRADG